MKILMCRPDHYGIFYEINPWMHINKPVRQSIAEIQWKNLYNILTDLNVEIILIHPIEGLPDMVFTANAGLIYQQQVWVSFFKASERKLESFYFRKWFNQENYVIVNEKADFNSNIFEGAGDALFFNNHLIAGYGFRTNISIYQETFFHQFNKVLCELVDPYFYHLDTCFCPLNSSLALWYPNAFSKKSQQMIRRLGQFIEVPENEAKHFACNAVVVGKNIILPTYCPETYRQLELYGFQVHPCDMSEYIKSGGACKCLTLKL